VKYGAECVYPVKKRFDLDENAARLAKRHKGKKGGVAGAGAANGSGAGLDKNAATPAAPGTAGNNSPAVDMSSTIAAALGQVAAAPYDSASASEHPTPGQPGQPGSATQQTQNQPPGIFNVDELMAFFRQTQMGAYFRSRVEPPDFLRPAFPDAEELQCVRYTPRREHRGREREKG
jgi:hypothetical protein